MGEAFVCVFVAAVENNAGHEDSVAAAEVVATAVAIAAEMAGIGSLCTEDNTAGAVAEHRDDISADDLDNFRGCTAAAGSTNSGSGVDHAAHIGLDDLILLHSSDVGRCTLDAAEVEADVATVATVVVAIDGNNLAAHNLRHCRNYTAGHHLHALDMTSFLHSIPHGNVESGRRSISETRFQVLVSRLVK